LMSLLSPDAGLCAWSAWQALTPTAPRLSALCPIGWWAGQPSMRAPAAVELLCAASWPPIKPTALALAGCCSPTNAARIWPASGDPQPPGTGHGLSKAGPEFPRACAGLEEIWAAAAHPRSTVPGADGPADLLGHANSGLAEAKAQLSSAAGAVESR